MFALSRCHLDNTLTDHGHPYNSFLRRFTTTTDVKDLLAHQHQISMVISFVVFPTVKLTVWKESDHRFTAWYYPMGSTRPVPVSLLHNGAGINLKGWINTGNTEDGMPVTLCCARFDTLPGLEIPKMTTCYSIFYASQENWNPQATNIAIENAVTDEQVIVGWKGDVLIVKHGCHCNFCFTDITKEDRALCNAIVTAAIYNGQL